MTTAAGASGQIASTSTQRQTWSGVAALVVCAALWSLNGPLIKLLGASQGLDPLSIAFYRSLIGGVVLAPIAWSRRMTLQSVRPVWPLVCIAAFTLMTVCFVRATASGSAANAIVLQYTAPLWVFLLSPMLLGERPRRAEGAALLIAMVGIGVILAGHPPRELPVLAVALASGLGFGLLTVLLRRLRTVDATLVVAVNLLGSGLLLLGGVALWGRFALSGREAAMVLALALVQFAIPYVIYTWALQRVAAHQASLLVLLECVLNPLWTYLAIGEVPPTATLIGGPLILLGVAAWIVTAWHGQRARRRAAALAPAAAES